jgi:hypothetical protein
MSRGSIVAVMFLVGVFILLGGIAENTTIGSTAITMYDNLLHPSIQISWNPIGVIASVMQVSWTYLSAFFNILAWNYPFLTGQWENIKYIILYPVSIAVIVGIIAMLLGSSGG